MCLFLDVNFKTSTWAFVLTVVSIAAVMIGLYGQFKDITRGLREIKRGSESLRCLKSGLEQLKKDVCLLKEAAKVSETELMTLQGQIKLLKSDKTGLVDFAYKGKVISTRDTETFAPDGTSTSRSGLCGQRNLATRILESSVMPGDCWPIRGQEGTAVIALIGEVLVTKVTLEHASRSLLPNNTSLAAPKQFSLWGLQDENELESGTAHFFGQFEYSLANPEVQSFFVVHPSNKTFRIVGFKVQSNHGHPDFTCIYRVRVHGRVM